MAKSRNMRKKGGSAWQYTQSVYGGPHNQHSVGILPNGGTSNVISTNQSGGGIPALNYSSFGGENHTSTTHPTNMHGGKSLRRGGNILSELAVPASLLIANEIGKRSKINNYFGKMKTNKKYKNKRNRTFRRRGRR